MKFRFGDVIKAIDDGEDAASVTFESGGREDFDLVIVAEGVGSSTRKLVFRGENEPRWLDVTMGYFTIPKGHGMMTIATFTGWRGAEYLAEPGNKGTTRAMLVFQKEAVGEDELSPNKRRRSWSTTFAMRAGRRRVS